MNPDEHREQGLGSRRGLEAWVLWVLASAVGGGAGGATLNTAFIGPLVLFGAVLGAAQALIVWRYMGGWASINWLVASVLGWPLGAIVANVVKLPLRDLVPEIFQNPSYQAVMVNRAFEPITWVVFGAFQCMALLPILGPALGRRSSRLFAALGVLSSALGGALAVAASFAINATVLPLGNGDLFWEVTLPQAVGQAVGGALYGVVTGVIIARIVRQAAQSMRPPGSRPRLLPTAAGLAAFMALCLAVAWWSYVVQEEACSDEEQAVFEEFPQYGERQIEPESAPTTGSCVVRFETPDPEGEIFAYYSQSLLENGWEIDTQPPPYSELTEFTGPEATIPARVVPSGLVAMRGVYVYQVRYNQQPRSEQGRIVAVVSKRREPPE